MNDLSQSMELHLPAKPPFSLASLIRSHGWVQLLPFDSDDDHSQLDYVTQLNSGKVVNLRVQEEHAGVVVSVAEQVTPDELREIEDTSAWMLELDFDLSDFYQVARSEPKLAHTEARASGRILRCATVFEDVVKTILTTNTTWGGTKRMVRGLVENYGAPLAAEPERKAFPSAQRLAQAEVETLRQECKLGYRAPYILELAQKQAGGEVDLEALKSNALPTPELRKQLLSLKGVGDYAAANLLMILGRYDTIPVDSWALTMVSKEWFDGQPVGRADVEAAFEKWGEYKGLAYWLWDWTSS